jgi:hypothetical protein
MVKNTEAPGAKWVVGIGALILVAAITDPASGQSEEENFQAFHYQPLDAVKDAYQQ